MNDCRSLNRVCSFMYDRCTALNAIFWQLLHISNCGHIMAFFMSENAFKLSQKRWNCSVVFEPWRMLYITQRFKISDSIDVLLQTLVHNNLSNCVSNSIIAPNSKGKLMLHVTVNSGFSWIEISAAKITLCIVLEKPSEFCYCYFWYKV